MHNPTPAAIGSAAAAAALQIDRSTLTRWVKARKITPVLRGSGATGEMFFDPRDVAKLAPSSAAPDRADEGVSSSSDAA